MKRGIVTCPANVEFHKNNAHISISNTLTEDDLNFLAFFWDDIAVLNTENISFGLLNEKEFLEAGILRRPTMGLIQEMTPQQFVKSFPLFQQCALDALRNDDKGTYWYFHQASDELNFSENQKKKVKVKIDFIDLLRGPEKGTHIQDILRFKDDCKDDLNALHEYMEKIYSDIIESHDFDLTRAKNYSFLREAILNLDKACAFKWRSPVRMSAAISPEIDGADIKDLLNPIVSGVMTGSYGGVIPGVVSAICPIALGFIQSRLSWVGFRDKGLPQLAYLTKAIEKGIL